MLIIGHSAFGYLLLKLYDLILRRDTQSENIIFAIVLANILDCTHLGYYRALLHNHAAALIFSLILVIMLKLLKLIEYKDGVILFLIIYLHYPIGDRIFGHFIFPVNLWVEPLIFGILLLIFKYSKDYDNLRCYIQINKPVENTEISYGNNKFMYQITLILLIGWFVFNIAQFYLVLYIPWEFSFEKIFITILIFELVLVFHSSYFFNKVSLMKFIGKINCIMFLGLFFVPFLWYFNAFLIMITSGILLIFQFNKNGKKT